MKKICLSFLFVPALLLCRFASAQVSLGGMALTTVTIIDANHRVPLAAQTVLIEGGKIKDVFADGSKPIPASYAVLPLKGKFLLPGLIDTHVHLATDPSGVDNRAHTLAVLRQMLYSGITTVRDMAGDARTLAGLSRDALTNDIISPDIYYSALMAGPTFFSDPRTGSSTKGAVSGKMPYMLAVTDSTNLQLAIAEAKGTGATGIKLYANLSPGLVGKIVSEATRQGMIVWGHAWLQQARPSDLVKAGVSSISHAPLVIHEKFDKIPDTWKKHHTNRFWDDSIPNLNTLFILMKQRGTILDATLLTYKNWAQTDTAMQYDYEIGKRLTIEAYKAGVTICTGTDDDQEAFVQDEIKLLVSDAGFKPIDAIIAATLNGAMALNIANTHGTIWPGKTADLLVLDKNPLVTLDNLTSVYLVIKKGFIFKK
ncbi:Imidazolonepropionase [Mucilaginibacter sp. OK268]|uniref:amidohydrolase family protein n=1 Tax=Mucilaginibacter sp. OK268 TaxID=1881048 RepID=UPI00088DCD86|nr:amidohydrolase family protein [Mucilaginibacter sp. OK268]SDP76213.1 Imidazolonepropionase [Mucilaginibacter sp. OK268]